MSLLFGLFSPGGERVPEGLLERIEHHCDWPRDRVLRHAGPGFALLALQGDTVPRVGEPRLLREGGHALLFSGRIDNREELAARYGLAPIDALDDEDFVAAAWRAQGPDFCQALVGDFAMALHDPAAQRLVLARDALGVMPLYRAQAGPFVAFSNCIEYLRLVPGIDLAWHERWIADTLRLANEDVERTAYRAIRAVPPGHTLTFEAAGQTARRFWSLPCPAPLEISSEEATAQFRRLFDRAVTCRLRAVGPVASELSGGLDSTSIAVTAAAQLAERGERLLAFSHALPETDEARALSVRDERREIEAVLAAAPRIAHRYVDAALESQVAVLARTLERHGAPPRNDLNAYGDGLAEGVRTSGARVLLSGFGGDQLVTGQGAGYLESLMEQGDWAAVRALMAARHGAVGGLARTLAYRTGIGRIGLARRSDRAQRASITAFEPLAEAGFLRGLGINPQAARMLDTSGSGTMAMREDAMLGSFNVAGRLQDSAIGAAARGFVYRYPMLDVRLLEFVRALPVRLKRTPAVRRRMIREAMAGRLPDIVRLRDDKSGATIPTVHLNLSLHAGEIAALIERHRVDPAVTTRARVTPVLDTLTRTQAHGEFAGPMIQKQVILLALLCLWAERDRAAPEESPCNAARLA